MDKRITRAIIIIEVCLEKVFMDSFIILGEMNGTVVISSIATIAQEVFLVFIFSLGVSDATYTNKVIIPDANVKINTKASHLINVFLKIRTEVNKATTKIEKAIGVGLIVIIIFVEINIVNIAIFQRSAFDLQNHCFF